MSSNYNYLIKYVRERHSDNSLEYFIENVKYSFIDEDQTQDHILQKLFLFGLGMVVILKWQKNL